jgi:hypothetical protein
MTIIIIINYASNLNVIHSILQNNVTTYAYYTRCIYTVAHIRTHTHIHTHTLKHIQIGRYSVLSISICISALITIQPRSNAGARILQDIFLGWGF